jgi:membrane-bound lytic murein transglycosylase MltF
LGFEYELAQEFAKSIGVRLEVVIPPNRQALLDHYVQTVAMREMARR